MSVITESFTKVPESVMSNFDHTINHDIGKKLKTGKYYSSYTGWNFIGYVWWNENKWSCEIWQYHKFIETIDAPKLAHIMILVSEKYGHE